MLEAALRDRGVAVTSLLDAQSAVTHAEDAVTARIAEVATVVAGSGFDDEQQALDAILPGAEREALESRLRAVDADVERIRRGLAEDAVATLPPDVDVDLEGCAPSSGRRRTPSGWLRSRPTGVPAGAGRRKCGRRHRDGGRALDPRPCRGGSRRPDGDPRRRIGDRQRQGSLARDVRAGQTLRGRRGGRQRATPRDVRRALRARTVRREGGRPHPSDGPRDEGSRPQHRDGPRPSHPLGWGDLLRVALPGARHGRRRDGRGRGVDLGTLFVDEGFGSLDPGTLEAVLGELGKLRAGGRVVGVVSHVDALKQSIAERVEVRRLPNGASTLTVRRRLPNPRFVRHDAVPA
ncbi:hypothetical protein NKG05_11575 [Oerskovia sp. M15]